ncbi:MAG: 30S ribosomal protein S20 [Elusimicrobia bacterium]|nr:30S ribosomal protein S20 [Elusimicrobiota bacterium]
MARLKTGRHTSALKAHRQSLRHRTLNSRRARQIKSLTKELLREIEKKNASRIQELFPQFASSWDRAARKGLVHRRTASRKISRLSRKVRAVVASSI